MIGIGKPSSLTNRPTANKVMPTASASDFFNSNLSLAYELIRISRKPKHYFFSSKFLDF